MGRNATVLPEWQAVIKAVGGVGETRKALGVSQSTFYRVTHGEGRWPADRMNELEVLCEVYDVPNPLENERVTVARNKDLLPLRILGDALLRGMPAATRKLAELHAVYPEKQLLELAESDGTGPEIMAAVQALLEYEPS